MDAAEKLADGMIYDPIDPAMPQSGNNAWRYARDPAFRKQVEDVRTTTPAELLHAADTAWSKYTAKYDENARNQWQLQYDKALKQLDSEHIAPLAVAHATWMRSQRIANYYACNFDPDDAESGAVYTRTVALCIEGTQDKKACFDLYEEWFGGDLTDRKNLILRALLFNLDQQAGQIKQTAKPNVPLETQPWDDMIGAFGNAVEKVRHNEADTLGRLITSISGIVGKLMRMAAEGPVKQGLIALSVVSRQPLVQVEITGSKKAFRALLIRQMLNTYDQKISPNQIQRAVSAELRRLQINGVKMDGTEKKKFLLLVDPEHIKRMPLGLAPSARAQWLARSVRTVEQFEEALGINRWRQLMERGSAVGRTSTPFVIGAAMMVAQWTAIGKLTEDAANSMNHNATEAKNRLWAGYIAFGGTAAEVSGAALGRIAGRFELGKGFGALSNFLKNTVGKNLGIVGAGIMAVWDAKNAKDSFQQGNTGMGIAYLASATFGFVAALLIAFGATGIGLLLIGIVIAIAVLIEIYKDNKLQEWLKRCYWGKLSSERYPGHLTERQQFELALKG